MRHRSTIHDGTQQRRIPDIPEVDGTAVPIDIKFIRSFNMTIQKSRIHLAAMCSETSHVAAAVGV